MAGKNWSKQRNRDRAARARGDEALQRASVDRITSTKARPPQIPKAELRAQAEAAVAEFMARQSGDH